MFNFEAYISQQLSYNIFSHLIYYIIEIDYDILNEAHNVNLILTRA